MERGCLSNNLRKPDYKNCHLVANNCQQPVVKSPSTMLLGINLFINQSIAILRFLWHPYCFITFTK